MGNQNVSLQELSGEIGKAWAKALQIHANVKSELEERPKDEWLALLSQLKAKKTNIK